MYMILTLGVLAFAFSLVLTPLIRNYCTAIGLVDRPDRRRKLHPHPIPRVGGIAIAASYVGAFAVVLLLPFSTSAILDEALPKFWRLLPALELVFVIGLLDDVAGLRPWQKVLGQAVAALFAYSGGVRIDTVGGFALEPWIAIPVTILWLVICANAFNLIDGLDGLATGVGLFATLTVLVAALIHSDMDLVLVAVPLAGCLLGFLRYNFNPASVFLGDCGSLLIGFVLGCFGALWSHKSATLLGITAPLMAVSIPLLDACLSILRRFLRKQPIFGADRGHIHHRLLDRGLTPRRAAFLMYGMCGVAAIFSLLQNMFENEVGGVIIVLFCLAAWIGVQHLGYAEFGMARQMFLKGTFRRIIDAQTSLKAFERSLAGAESTEQFWTALCEGAKAFGFRGVHLHVHGHAFRDSTSDLEGLWQVRIPLPGSQYVNFEREFDAGLESLPIGAFVNAVESAVRARFLSSGDHALSTLRKLAASGTASSGD